MASNLQKLRVLFKPKLIQNLVLKNRYSTKQPGGGLPENLRRAYEHYQREDGVPIYLKGGLKDRLLLGLTVAVLAIGLVDAMYTLTRLDVRK